MSFFSKKRGCNFADYFSFLHFSYLWRKIAENTPAWVDPVVGVRWIPQISENWHFILKGDIGGFGVASDFTWNLQGGFVWDATDYLSLVFQYHAVSVDYSTGKLST
jgi:hypothetical protein